jgi:hypothetical protein
MSDRTAACFYQHGHTPVGRNGSHEHKCRKEVITGIEGFLCLPFGL